MGRVEGKVAFITGASYQSTAAAPRVAFYLLNPSRAGKSITRTDSPLLFLPPRSVAGKVRMGVLSA
jgi:hypothetical protein